MDPVLRELSRNWHTIGQQIIVLFQNRSLFSFSEIVPFLLIFQEALGRLNYRANVYLVVLLAYRRNISLLTFFERFISLKGMIAEGKRYTYT